MSKYQILSNILDVGKFDPDKDTNRLVYGQSGAHYNARRRLLNSLQEQRYADTLALLHALLDTKRYKLARYWKVGAELVQELVPEGLTDYLEVAFAGSNRHTILPTFHAWIQQLVKTGQISKAREELEFRVEREPFASDPFVRKNLALILYEEWCEAPDKITEQRSRNTLNCLEKAYGLIPDDVHVLQAYLEVSTKLGLDVTDVVQDAWSSSTIDPYKLSVLLKYVTDDLDRESLLEQICRLDPTADADVALKPLLSLIRSKEKIVAPAKVYLTFELLLDRLEHGIADDWTLNTLLEHLQALDERSEDIRTQVIQIAQSRSANDTVDFLQTQCYSTTDHTFKTLQTIRQRINPAQARENNHPRIGKIVEYNHEDPWHSFLFGI
ncbi:hypothetical protein EC973_000997 [Apophysomyces ossiformis]|uniref:Uncharacterized protein n=1 Tax=Apophysomyces ossiformis TaxID=679940 RepID=A0A8H7BY24_9FUNG|nr:hypothetical protein EC973_000997 [Apophysomyces ossiformis]